MKVALVTDTHAGVRNDLECLQEHQNKFWTEVFFPELTKRGIKHILHGGDFFDKRQHLTLKTMQNTRDVFCGKLNELDFEMHLIIGNHDVLYKNTNEINSPNTFFANQENIHIISEPTVFENILMVPWINKENAYDYIQTIKESNEPYCYGHFEINGFEMHKGTVAHDGIGTDIFDSFNQVFSGHFHTQSEKGNIKYLGSPFEMTWNDFNDKRGFHIFDTETGEIEFIEYEESMFFKVIYHNKDNKEWIPYKPEKLNGKFVKIVINEKDSYYDLDVWLKEIESYVPQQIEILDTTIMYVEDTEINIEKIESQSNYDIINEQIEKMNNKSKKEKQKIKSKILEYYTEVSNS